jgi:hypothetical protein
VGEVVIDLAPHPLHLPRDLGRQLGVPGRAGTFAFLVEHGQRRLEPVRQVTGLAERALHARFTIAQQRIQVVDERLDLRRILAFQAAVTSFSHVLQACAERFERREAATHLHETGNQRDHGEQGDGDQGAEDAMEHARRLGVQQHDMREHEAGQAEEPGGPQDRAQQDARAKGPQPRHACSSIR